MTGAQPLNTHSLQTGIVPCLKIQISGKPAEGFCTQSQHSHLNISLKRHTPSIRPHLPTVFSVAFPKFPISSSANRNAHHFCGGRSIEKSMLTSSWQKYARQFRYRLWFAVCLALRSEPISADWKVSGHFWR